MKAPQKGRCIVCHEPYRTGQNVRIQTWGHHNESPLVRLRHPDCDPGIRRPNARVGKQRSNQ